MSYNLSIIFYYYISNIKKWGSFSSSSLFLKPSAYHVLTPKPYKLSPDVYQMFALYSGFAQKLLSSRLAIWDTVL